MQTSRKLGLPMILPQQAQKHVTHNEALDLLDVLVHLTVTSAGLTTPPPAPADGACYIVGAPGEAAWTGREGQIACWRANDWSYIAPEAGFVAYVSDEAQLRVYSGSGWISQSGQFAAIGIGTDPDEGNPLTVRAATSLFNHAGNDHRIAINRAGAADTASVIFQSGFMARAEIGLAGNDFLSIKTADSGGAWREAMAIDPDSAEVRFPSTPHLLAPPLFNLLGDAGRCAGSPESQGAQAGAFVAPSYLEPYGGAAIAEGVKFIYNNSSHGGVEAPLDPLMDELMAQIHPDPAGSIWRYGPEFFTVRLDTGSTGTVGASHGGQPYFLTLLMGTANILREVTLGYWLRAIAENVLLIDRPTHRLFVDGVAQSANRVISPGDGWVEVAIRISHDAATYLGYDQLMTNLYTAPSSVCHLALMNLYPGHRPLSPSTRTGLVGSLTGWR